MSTSSRSTLLLACALLLQTSTLLQAVPSHAASAEAVHYAKGAYRTTNVVREEADRRRLRHSDCLQRFANRQAVRLAATSDLEHQDLTPILQKCGLNLTGENLAIGYATGRKAVRVGWWNSPSHRANLLERRYRLMALAARVAEDGRWVAVQLFGRKG